MAIDQILVLDFGSQYNQLIIRRFREMGVYSELAPYDISAKTIRQNPKIKGLVLSGGPHSVYEDGAFAGDPQILELGIPILGICYGMHWIAIRSNGEIKASLTREYGAQKVIIKEQTELLDDISELANVWMSHGDFLAKVPDEFRLVASSQSGMPAIICHKQLPIYGVQFHPEVGHTDHGNEILKNFAHKICHAKSEWNMDHYIETQIEQIRQTVGSESVLMAVSGGVDSSVAAVLIHKAIGNQLTCMFIDHGLMRKNEAEDVVNMFKKVLDIKLNWINAKDRFLEKLTGVVDPEQKRKIIGNEFIAVFTDEALKIGDFAFLGQGTIYADVIESGTKTAATIKSHHNVGGLPKTMKFMLIEPLNKLFKDEVRKLGIALGIPKAQVNRIPFPGPGLAIRILGSVNEERLMIVRESDAILQEEILRAGLNNQIWQYFTILLGVKSVGVMGDKRTYCETVAIRAVTSQDGMTADWAKIPYDVLDIISRRIVNEIPGVNRVVYDITSKPPSTIEWE
ncbi:MAG: glutamine-hydrolyzing GMP synthase [Candidatus Izemoplasmatales bacterium]